MAQLTNMPQVIVTAAELVPFGREWTAKGGCLSRTPPFSSSQLGALFDEKVAHSLAQMLGGIGVIVPNINSLMPAHPDAVECGPARVVGGVRPQNFDVAYRPDGVRFAFDSKTLNDKDSVKKNYQNMINDIATEATTVHTRFPYAVVGFMVVIPRPALMPTQEAALVRTLERLTGRRGVNEPPHMAEAVSLVIWEPATGDIDQNVPSKGSPLRIETFSEQVSERFVERYKGLPPHE